MTCKECVWFNDAPPVQLAFDPGRSVEMPMSYCSVFPRTAQVSADRKGCLYFTAIVTTDD